jgi:putative SOS response-associated peptidase YedK
MLVEGYYEWDETNKDKIRPFLIQNNQEDGLLYLACLYNNAFTDRIGDDYNHFVVLTVGASENIRHIHDRRPVFLDEHTK